MAVAERIELADAPDRDRYKLSMAEGEGFEPSDQGLPGQQLSRLPHSTALPPLRDDET